MSYDFKIHTIKKQPHILLIGPVTNLKANLIGGATISFGYLCDYLREYEERFTLVNTKKYFGRWSSLTNPIYVLTKVMTHIFNNDVVFLNSSRGGTKHLAPLLYLLAKLFNVKFVFRPFGGNIKAYTSEYSSFRKWIFNHTVLKADVFFLQTEALLKYYSEQQAKTFHLPTSRDEPPAHLLKADRSFQKRFVYLGMVSEAKGIDLILEAARRLGGDYVVHIYGPVKEAVFNEKLKQQKGIYKGVLDKEAVLSTLKDYDVLMLPTHYEGEGYPGVIIEAYALGLPVIATRWKSIPEIVRHGETGRLIATRSVDELVTAMQFFNTTNYPKYAQQARDHFVESFSTKKVTGRAIEKIKALFN